MPQQDLTHLWRGIGSPGPFRLFVLVLSLAEEMLMGTVVVPEDTHLVSCSWRATRSSWEPQAFHCTPASCIPGLWGGCRFFIGKRNNCSPGGAGLLQAVFLFFFFEVSLFLLLFVICSPHPALLLPGNTCCRGHRHSHCLSWSGALLLCICLKCWRHLSTEPDCALGVGVSSEEP